MIVATAMLIFLLLIFAPIPFVMHGRYIFGEVDVQIEVCVCGLLLAKERVFVNGNGVGYQGTVDGYLQTDEDSKQSGIDVAKSICLHKVLLCLRQDFSKLNVNLFVLQNAIFSAFSQIVCGFTNCQFACISNNFSDVSDFQIFANATISVAELSFCFIKQGVRKCKHKLQKS